MLKKWKLYCGSSSKIGISVTDIPSLLPTTEAIFSSRRLRNTFLFILVSGMKDTDKFLLDECFF